MSIQVGRRIHLQGSLLCWASTQCTGCSHYVLLVLYRNNLVTHCILQISKLSLTAVPPSQFPTAYKTALDDILPWDMNVSTDKLISQQCNGMQKQSKTVYGAMQEDQAKDQSHAMSYKPNNAALRQLQENFNPTNFARLLWDCRLPASFKTWMTIQVPQLRWGVRCRTQYNKSQ